MFYKGLEEFKNANGYEIEGVWYPRVTSIVSIKAKPALYAFYASLPDFKTGEAIKAKSAEEGTLIHDTVEAILKNESVVVPDQIKPAVAAFRNFLNENEVAAHRIEERIISRTHHYSGTLDVLADVNGTLGVLDIKTSNSIYRDYNIQTAAYVEALRENSSIPPLARWVLRINQFQKCLRCPAVLREKGGNSKIRGEKWPCQHEWAEVTGECEFKELKDFDHDIKAFLACKTLWEWENVYWLRQI